VQTIQPRRFFAQVAQMQRITDTIMRLCLKLPDDLNLQFFAGQYLDIITDDGQHRSFSIANAPHESDHIELHIRHVEGGEYTHYLFYDMPLTTELQLEAPLGTFYLRENSTRPIILMGGGTGFAPLKGILEHAFHIGVTRPMHLFWGARKQEDLYLDEQPRDWVKQYSHFQYTPVLSEPHSDWQGETGYVHQTVLAHYPDLQQSEVYMSGPPKMIDSGRELFLRHGLTMHYLYSDAFEFNSHPGIGLEE